MIGIFDSGIGGLTIVREIMTLLPEHQIVYFGDTARTPYGNKSDGRIQEYAKQDTQFLLDQGAHLIIIACNSASAAASEMLKKTYSDVPVFEVISPAVQTALKTSRNKRIGLIGTRATVQSTLYQNMITGENPEYTVFSRACPLFVPLAEENLADHTVTKMMARKYLQPLKQQQIDTLILGCTHYPLLKKTIQAKMGRNVTLVDPAEEMARQVKNFLEKNPDLDAKLERSSKHAFYFSDIAPHLKNMAERWLGSPVQPQLHPIS